LSIKRLTVLTEITFWNVTIYLLSTSRFFQDVVRVGYRAFEFVRLSIKPTTVLFLAISGWGMGVVIGFLVSIIWR
jgi:hypothetical protein